jgi:flagellar hook-basal body complex protein FliE
MAITSLVTSTLPLTPGGQAPALTPTDPSSSGTGASSFGTSLTDLVSKIDGTASDANTAVSNMLDGTGDVHEAMIALQRADMMLQLTVQVRNKLVQAYQDVMRMPI